MGKIAIYFSVHWRYTSLLLWGFSEQQNYILLSSSSHVANPNFPQTYAWLIHHWVQCQYLYISCLHIFLSSYISINLFTLLLTLYNPHLLDNLSSEVLALFFLCFLLGLLLPLFQILFFSQIMKEMQLSSLKKKIK